MSDVSLLLEDRILSAATIALSRRQEGLSSEMPTLAPLPSGAFLLYPNAFFPWLGLPYPVEHAKLGVYLAQLGHEEVAQKMARFQQALCDHRDCPIPTLFNQEGKCTQKELEEASWSFFDLVGRPSLTLPFIDEELGFVRHGDAHTTSIVTATGCITGLGTFLYKDAGILTFGPQLSRIGDCGSFGIAGRRVGWTFDREALRCRYSNRIAIAHPRETGIPFLSDAGFSGRWIEVEQQLAAHYLTTQAVMTSLEEPCLNWTLFARGLTCIVAGSHRLSANSLDRYHGPIQPLQVVGYEGGIDIAIELEGKMEIIPLAGDESFWGANFLIALTPTTPEIKLTFSQSNSRP